MSLFFLHCSPGSCIPCAAPYVGERKDEKRPLFLDSGGGYEFLAELCCDLVSPCIGWYLDVALGYVCVCECRYFHFCLPHSVSVSMRVEFVCICLS